MMRKKTIVIAAILSVLGVIQANAQVTFGVKAGLNGAKEIEKADNITTKAKGLTGLHIGAVAEISIAETFSIEPGLLLSRKGGIYSGDDRYTTTYAEVPLNLVYKHALGNESIRILGFGGPYAGFLLSAKEKYGNQSADAKSSYNSLDYGINIGTGVEINKVTVGIQYGIGLANISSVTSVTTKNNVFGISIGYKFRKD